MARNLYGLLVGIDNYQSPVPKLRGCVNDIEAFAEYLRGRAQGGEFGEPNLRLLKNEEATRQNIISGFREHFRQAGPDDVTLFYYSGHGSQEHAPEEFWHLEPDKLDETLVCYDSRSEGSWDLADKELAKLISEVAQKGSHTVVILDCCHSGSGTRNPEMAATAVRRAPVDSRQRPLDTFFFSEAELATLTASREAGENYRTSGWSSLTEGRHVLLAACHDSEEAKEYQAEGKSWGTFSYYLRQILESTTRPLSYRELLARTRARVVGSVTAQAPQLESSEPEDANQTFLGGAVAPRTSFLIAFDRELGWTVQAGAVHGIPAPTDRETTHLALFAVNASAEDLRDPAKAVAAAEVRLVQPEKSRIEIQAGESLDEAQQYQAVITSLPLPPLPVRFEGDPLGIEFAREALNETGPNGGPSLYVGEAEETPKYRLLAKDLEYIITRPADDRPLVRQISGGYSPANARRAIEQLEHVARWQKTVELGNPISTIDPTAIKMVVHYDGNQVESGDITLHYSYEKGGWQRPTFRLELKNEGNRPLYCAVLDLSESYAISSGLFPAGGVWLQPGQAAWVYGNRPIPATVPDDLWKAGVTERKDILKLIMSTGEFDPRLLEQKRLEAPRLRTKGLEDEEVTRSLIKRSTLNRLMKRVQTREVGGEDVEVGAYDDWATKEISFTTVRPREEVPVPESGEGAPLGFGVTLEPHPSFRARVRPSTVTEVSRGLERGKLGNLVMPEILRQDPTITQPFSFTLSRGHDPGLSVLELNGVENYEAVTADHPLVLTVDAPLEEDERLLPFAFDGEFFLPLGFAQTVAVPVGRGETAPSKKTKITIERLPEPESLRTKNLTGSIRILFQKVISQRLGAAYEHPLLAAAEVSEDGKVSYEQDQAKVKEQVASAQRVLLFIHGITGDTLGLAASAQLAKIMKDGQEQPLKAGYDLILTFDYENLHTSIEENARLLRARLEGIGLGPHHGKTLYIVAHSMGGLVSRWFIEREGGKEVVQHLVMVGTPNAGSPWSSVQDWATMALGVALNGLSVVPWAAPVLGGLVTLVEKADVTLDQMNTNSDFIKEIAKSPDPGIPYTILAGNTSLPAKATEPAGGDQPSLFERLLKKLNLKQQFRNGLTSVLFKEDNDIAVAVKSIKAVAANRSPAPTVEEVACDHITYFTTEVGLTALARALERKID